MGRRHQGAPQGHLRAVAPCRRLLARPGQGEGGPVDARIINTTSVSGIYGNIGQTNYGAAKAGIASFTVIAARELGRYGVTVNAISPSAFTRMTEDLREYTEEDRKRRDPKWVAPVSTWLVSEGAARSPAAFPGRQRHLRRRRGLAQRPEVEQIMDPIRPARSWPRSPRRRARMPA